MKDDLRKLGIEIVGDVPWGTHLCQFYQSKEDLIEILVPYFKQGLEDNEFCMWVTSAPLGVEDAKAALKEKVKNLDRYIKKGQIEILDYSQWYTKTGKFDADIVLNGWLEKENQAIERGFDGLRLTGNTLWLEKKDWGNFADYEKTVNSVIGKYRMLVICSYCVDRCSPLEIIDVVKNHQFAVIKSKGKWISIESSERAAMREALWASEEKYRVLFEQSGEAIFIADIETGILLECNSRARALIGRDRSEIIGIHQSELHPKGEAEKYKTKFARHVEKGHIVDFEGEVQHKDGRRIPVWISAQTIKMGDRNAIVGLFIDITERKKAERSHLRLISILEATPDFVGFADAKDKHIEYINSAGRRMCGIGKDEDVTKLKIFDVHPDWVNKMFSDEILPVAVREGTWMGECAFLNIRDGHEIPVLMVLSSHKAPNGEVEIFSTISRDITERKKAEDQIKRDKEYAELLLGVIPSAVFTVDTDRHITSWNKKAEEITGYNAKEIIGKECTLFAETPCNDKCGLYSEDVKKPVVAKECIIIKKDGQEIFILKKADLLKDEKGNIIGGIESFEDIDARKKAEKYIKKQNEFVETVINSLQYPFYVIGTDYTIILSNKAAKEKGVVEGGRCYQLTHRCQEPCSGEHICPLKEVIRTGKPIITEHVHFDKDGNYRNFEVRGDPILDKDGQVIQMIEYSIDITEHKRAEEALRESEKLLTQAQQLAQLGSWKFTPATGKTMWSEEMFRIYGLEPVNEAPPFEVLAEMVHREDRQAWGEAIDKARHTGAFYNLEYRIIRPDGQCRWLLAQESMQPESKDTPLVFYGTVLDITEHKKAEEALRTSEAKYRLLAENLPQKIFIKDRNLVYIFCNKNYGRDLKIEDEEIKGKTDYDFYPKELAIKYRADDKRVIESGKIEDIEEKYIQDGRERFVHTIKTPVKDERGNVIGILGIFRDITEHKKMEVELRTALTNLKEMQGQLIQAAKLEAIGRLASGVAHEVRNPLGTILQAVDYLEGKIPSGQKEILQMIKNNIKRADNIIRTLIDFSKATQLNLSAEDINPVLEASLVLIQHRTRLENIELIKELEEGLPKVLIDRIRIEQVFVNILINAVEAMPQGGKLRIRTYKKQLSKTGFRIGRRKNDGDYFEPRETIVVAEIEDRGAGISEDNLKEIFEPFFTTKGPDRGTGLGLSVTKNIIDLHKGLIDVKSKVGEGTKVIISLKVAKEGRHG